MQSPPRPGNITSAPCKRPVYTLVFLQQVDEGKAELEEGEGPAGKSKKALKKEAKAAEKAAAKVSNCLELLSIEDTPY